MWKKTIRKIHYKQMWKCMENDCVIWFVFATYD